MKGRPEGSIVRNRIVSIIKKVETSYGYEIYKLYKELFGNVHIRTIYYNLKKGIEKEEIIVVNVKRELGNYSWGDEVEKVYFSVGPYAKTSINKLDLAKINSLNKKTNIEINWKNEMNQLVSVLKKKVLEYKQRYSKLSSQGKKLIKQRLEEKKKKIKQYIQGRLTTKNINEIVKEVDSLTL